MSKVIDNIEDIASIDSKSTISYVDSKPTGFKNYIINGNFDVWQYGTSQTSNGYGSDDRWSNGNSGSTKTHSQVACTDTERALFNASFFSRTVVSSVAGAGNFVIKRQSIEDVTRLAGKTVTISFWAKADGNKNIWLEFKQIFGTGGSPSSIVTGIYGQSIALTSTWQKKTINVTLPSIVGKTLGTDGIHTTYTDMQVWFDVGSAFTGRIPTGIQQSGTFDIAQVQVEEGSVATPFEQRPYGLELSLCQRYYEKSYNADVVPATVTSTGAISYRSPNGDCLYSFRTKVEKRTTATYTIYNPTTGAAGQARNIDASVNYTVTGGYASASGLTISMSGSSGAHIQFHYDASAEL